jgi:hypothetical protein
LDPSSVCFDVIRVDLVLWGCWIQGAEFEQDLYCSLVFGDGDSLGAFPFQVYGFIGVFDRESF